MTDLLKTVVLLFMTSECYDQYFVNFNFFHGECMKATLTKIVGLIIVAGSITVKVPQILKIIKYRSGEGLSIIGNILELSATTSFFLHCYLKQFPFSAWGDGLFLTIQTFIVIALILYYKNLFKQLVLFLSIFLTLVTLILTGIMPPSLPQVLHILNLPIIIIGKGMQALTNYKNQSTGQLSAITCWMQFGGATARVFTSIQETGDGAVILSFVLASILNGIIVFQSLYYAKSTQKKAIGKGKGKEKESQKGKKSQ